MVWRVRKGRMERVGEKERKKEGRRGEKGKERERKRKSIKAPNDLQEINLSNI